VTTGQHVTFGLRGVYAAIGPCTHAWLCPVAGSGRKQRIV